MQEVAAFGMNQIFWSVAASGPQVFLVGQLSTNNTPQVLRRSGTSWIQESVAGEMPLFGVAIDPAGTGFAVGPTFGGSFGAPQAGLWRRSA